jgi:hypothetical protein
MSGRGPSTVGAPGVEFTLFGVKTLLYLDGSVIEAFFVGDLVFPTSKAFSLFAGNWTDFDFGSALDFGPSVPAWRVPPSGSKAAPGSLSEDGALLARGPGGSTSLLGGLPMILPYLVKPGKRGSSAAFNGCSSWLCWISRGSDVRLPLALDLRLARLFLRARALKSPERAPSLGVCSFPCALLEMWSRSVSLSRFTNEYCGATSKGDGVKTLAPR